MPPKRPIQVETLTQKKQRYLNTTKLSGSKNTVGTAQYEAASKRGSRYNVGSNDRDNFFTDKNGKVLKQNNVIKFNSSFLGGAPGNWQIFPSASSGRSIGVGEITLVNETNGWNFSFDARKHKNFISASFIEFVDDGPT